MTYWLKQHYQGVEDQASLVTVGLGNSPNDLPMLEVVDIPIIIPGNGGPHQALAQRGWQIAPQPGCQGWALAISSLDIP